MSTAAPPQLTFEILGAAHEPHAVQPSLRFEMGVAEAGGREVYAITLTAQIMFDPAKREYDEATRAELVELFGTPERWPSTTHSFLWTHADALVHSFTGATTFGLTVPCTADLEMPATRYLAALPDGEVPLSFHFTGRVLYAGESRQVQVVHIGWDTMCRHRMPVSVFADMIDHHHGDLRFVRLHRDTLAALSRAKAQRGAHTYDALVTDLLEGAHAGDR